MRAGTRELTDDDSTKERCMMAEKSITKDIDRHQTGPFLFQKIGKITSLSKEKTGCALVQV